jgi:hypothetical protein
VASVAAKPNQVVLEKKLRLYARISNDSTLVVSGGVKKTTKQVVGTKQLWGGRYTTIKGKLKHLKRLRQARTRPKIKVKFAATDEFGQTATDVLKLTLCRKQFSHYEPCWRPR